ncbi:MAG TPA: hypothetical protein VGN42_15555 [Pirellulales bacterium]|jgi:hypothetical protein|nr:hypothetical protein [Pirellulales bacterium]
MRSPNDSAGASSPEPKLIEGKHAIIAVLVVALAGALGSWWYHGQLQRRAISLWGREVAELIQTAPHVELLKLEPAGDDAANEDRDMLEAAGLKLAVAERRDVSRAAGLIHLRHSLISDKSFLWSAPPADCQPQWRYALRFSDDNLAATLVFDFDCEQVMLAGKGARVSIEPMMRPNAGEPAASGRRRPAGIEKFVLEQFDQSG